MLSAVLTELTASCVLPNGLYYIQPRPGSGSILPILIDAACCFALSVAPALSGCGCLIALVWNLTVGTMYAYEEAAMATAKPRLNNFLFHILFPPLVFLPFRVETPRTFVKLSYYR